MADVLPCPFCGEAPNTFEAQGQTQVQCGGAFKDCCGSDVIAPVAMWNTRALISPAGEVVVPVVPTEAMQNAGVNAASDEFGWADEGQIKKVWQAMLSAAPRGMEG